MSWIQEALNWDQWQAFCQDSTWLMVTLSEQIETIVYTGEIGVNENTVTSIT